MFLVRNTFTIIEDSTGDSAEKIRQEIREILINKSLQSNQLTEQSEKDRALTSRTAALITSKTLLI